MPALFSHRFFFFVCKQTFSALLILKTIEVAKNHSRLKATVLTK